MNVWVNEWIHEWNGWAVMSAVEVEILRHGEKTFRYR